jgi:hypothetical protein
MIRIHINQLVIRQNKINGANDPPISVIDGRKITRHHEIEILGPARLIYSPDKPLKCGARVWIEAEGIN